MPFLDVYIKITNCTFVISVYRKITHTGVFLNFLSAAPTAWKRGVISCLLYRAKLICSTSSLFKTEVSKLKTMFIDNSYPASFFDSVLNKFLRKFNTSTSTDNSVSDDDNTDDNLPYVILRIPYLGKCSVDFAKNVSSCISRNFPVNVRTVYSTFKVKSYFNLKCFSPFYLSSNVVYYFECMSDSCTDNYIGLTTRHLYERVEEHVAFAKKGPSEVKTHINTCLPCKQHNVSHTDFQILRRCRNEVQCKLHEAFAI